MHKTINLVTFASFTPNKKATAGAAGGFVTDVTIVGVVRVSWLYKIDCTWAKSLLLQPLRAA